MPASTSRVFTPSKSETAAKQTRTAASVLSPSNRLWPRATTALLLLVGVIMAGIGFATVMSMPDMTWHSARDAELRATYDAYRDTGTLLIKETGSGSYGVQAPADGPLTFATWDDDPGSYIIASLMSHVTGSDSPYPGLKLAQALLVAIPLVWLPLAVARVVGRSRAGYALVLLPLVVWLFNHGATLVGTEYGLSNSVNTLPVYSLYGTAASMAFLSLALAVLLSTYRLSTVALMGATVGISILAAFGNMSRSLSGMGIAAAVGVLWWIHAHGRWKWVAALGGALVAVVLATVIQSGLMAGINVDRASTTGQSMTEAPDAHTAWHSLYLGLSYPEPINGQPSRFGVTWSDEFGWAKAREVDPDVLVASEEYDEILKDLYLEKVLGDPIGAVKLYALKAIYLAKHFGGLLLFIILGFAVGLSVRTGLNVRLRRVLAIVVPLLALGLVPAVLVMPMLYYYSELSAALGLLAAVSLGVIVWALTSWPARVRARESGRDAAEKPRRENSAGISVVLDDASLRPGDLDRIVSALTIGDEVILVGPHNDDEPRRDVGIADTPVSVRREFSDPVERIGQRLRAGVLGTSNDRVLVVGGALDVEPAELVEASRRVTGDVALSSRERTGRGISIDFLRKVLLGLGRVSGGRTIVLDGDRGRSLARMSKETDELWFDEIAFGVTAQGESTRVLRLDTTAGVGGDAAKRPFFSTLNGFSRIALRREEYAAARGAQMEG